MKLKYKLSLYNIITKLLLAIILWFAFPYVVKKVIYNKVDKNLLEKERKFTENIGNTEIEEFLLANDSTAVYGSFSTLHDEFIELEISPNQNKTKSDVFFNAFRKIENQESEYRILKHNLSYKHVNYQLEIGSNIKEIDDLTDLLHLIIIITFLIVTVFTFVIDSFYVSSMFQPFYKILESKIKLINNPEKFDYSPVQTTSSEFKELDVAINEMMIRINDLFKKEKEFIGNVSHELLTPVSILKNRFENLIQNQSLNDNAVDKISDSLTTLDLMKKVINNLLLISRIDNKQFQTNELINFNEIITFILENLEDRIDKKRVLVAKNLTQESSFYGNKILLQLLLTNLLTNAIKYNKIKGTIILSDEFIDGKYTLTIADTGIGMHQDQVLQIFNRFKRFNFEQEGQGIGLAIVASIANLHQIEIQVKSTVDQGTTFILLFPKVQKLNKY